MAILAISGEPASRWEEVAHSVAQVPEFELITECRLNERLVEEFGDAALPDQAWAAAVICVLSRFATQSHLVTAFRGAEHIFPSSAWFLRSRIVEPRAARIGNIMLHERLDKPAALARLRSLDTAAKTLYRSRFQRSAGATGSFDLTLNLGRGASGGLAEPQCVELLRSAASALTQQGLLLEGTAQELRFAARLQLARHGMTPGRTAKTGQAKFGHPSEELFANLLNFYRIPWQYEPRSFPLQWDKNGNVTEAFTPDFFLPEFDLYVELTTMKQSLVTRKNRKVKLLRAIYPHINIQVFYQKDFQDLIHKYGWKAS